MVKQGCYSSSPRLPILRNICEVESRSWEWGKDNSTGRDEWSHLYTGGNSERSVRDQRDSGQPGVSLVSHFLSRLPPLSHLLCQAELRDTPGHMAQFCLGHFSGCHNKNPRESPGLIDMLLQASPSFGCSQSFL